MQANRATIGRPQAAIVEHPAGTPSGASWLTGSSP
jgi:hypothetical protein